MGGERLLGELVLPLVTPFDARGEVDAGALRRLVEHVVAGRLADSLFVAGTTGEFYALTFDERLRLFADAKAASGGRLPLVAGTGAATTRETVALTEAAERLGYDAVAVIAPYFSRPGQDELYAHVAAAAAATRLPVVLYNIPLFTGVNLTPEVVARLAELPNVVAVKDQATANPLQVSDYLRAAPRLRVYSGDDPMTLPVLSQGGSGVVSGAAHVCGDLIREMIQRFKAGAVRDATALHQRLFPLYRALVPPGRANPVPLVREAIRLATGLEVGPPRPPLLPPEAGEVERLRAALAALGRLSMGGESER
ncbi:MAG: 4-hydroxy-tetrahydrodipicolinate synthase [Armatimonadota bacterium]|nr:4-hydroxy-tetrahydrodipicolinate synthase [Armatimonadota bacterium]MDR7452884.1 4-hydroxy-tetrahydrodipicolinate synthase [Armatimonadota bacterium]MDR7456194.1 4-hydroxy-tetrahydrodipicolinate synthase [Armatimonadota bacterium]MDR7496380.1 4-hydroxy-tetrahydrodipicolinate synthase [Armatimonadota bacterium]MDR7512661.1 4-hydroxy-tetrahydrodipicolinate synthase [Armatimonadota bacterium]